MDSDVRERSPDRAFVDKALDDLRTRLLDLTGRNPLLNYRARKRDVSVVDELPDVTFARLIDGGTFTLDPTTPLGDETEAGGVVPAPTPLELPTPSATPEARHHDDRLQTPYEPERLESKCRTLSNAARTALEETGANFLFLVIGFLDWYESDTSDRRLRAPLVLVPVEIKKGRLDKETGCFEYRVSYTQEDIETNLSLAEKLRREFGLELPEYSSDQTPESYFATVGDLVSGLPRWRVVREMGLGLFSFSKILIYRDLDPSRWPEGRRPAEHRVVSELIGGSGDPGDGCLQVGELYDVDDDPRADIPLILDADISQHSALVDALCGNKSLVIHGPPGTGKSQTISNLIAAAMHSGQSVLFVAEKNAALEVVRRRLDEKGLGLFVLELHSHRAKKGQLHADIGKRIQANWTRGPSIEQVRREWEKRRGLLRQFSVYALGRTEPDGDSFERVVWRAGRHRMPEGVTLPPELSRWARLLQREEVEEFASLLREFAALVAEAPSSAIRAWHGINLRNATPDTLASTEVAVTAIRDRSAELLTQISNARAEWELGLHQLFSLVGTQDRLSELPQAPPLTAEFWSIIATRSQRGLVRDAHAQLIRYRELQQIGRYLEPLEASDGPAGLEDLSRACELLDELGLAQLQLAEIEARSHDSAAVANALDALAGRVDDFEALLRRPPSYLFDWTRVLRVSELLATDPSPGDESVPRSWLARETTQIAVAAQERSQAIREELEEAALGVDLDLVPSAQQLRRIARDGEELVGQSFRRLRTRYRRLKNEIRQFSRGVRRPTDESVIASLRRLADAIEERDRFAVDDELRDHLGTKFRGTMTDWNSLIRGISWCGEVADAAGDTYLALDLLSNRSVSRANANSLAAVVGSDVAVLSDRCEGVLGEQSAEWHLETLAIKARELSETLRAVVPVLRAARAPVGATAASIGPDVTARLQARQLEAEFVSRADLAETFSSVWQGIRTETDALVDAAEWADQFEAGDLPEGMAAWWGSNRSAEDLDVLQATSRTLLLHLRELRETVDAVGGFSLEAWCREPSPVLSDLQSAAAGAAENSEFLPSVAAIARLRHRLEDVELADWADWAARDRPPASDAEAAFRHKAYSNVVSRALQKSPELRDFGRQRIDAAIREFSNLDRELARLNAAAIAHELAQRPVPPGITSGRVRDLTERALLEHEVGKQKRHIPIRKLTARAGAALKALKPCFMMSPMSVAQFLGPGTSEFDLVVMDEASQLKPEEALGALLRGRKAVIVGDPKQLPPTTFFERIGEVDESDADLAVAQEAESILEVAEKVFPARLLNWHYRSEHHSLIAFSNSRFYQGNLVVFPSPIEDSAELGVQLRYQPSGRYQARKNPVEARVVSEAVRNHLVSRPHESLGVATFNSEQRDLILEEIDRLQRTDPQLDDALRKSEDRDEPLFVKNLENIQGDERDVIFISTTFGPDTDTGRVYQRFGPIGGELGWRRLNVILTRAKRRLEVFTSMRSADVLAGPDSAPGVTALKAFLAYAETGVIPDFGTSTGEPDSDFEIDVAQVLSAHGYQCDAQVGVVGYAIDIAVRDPRGAGFVLGIECDGATYHSAKSVRDRDRLRQEILERKGWRIHRIWSTDWFMNRAKETERLLDAVDQSLRRVGAR